MRMLLVLALVCAPFLYAQDDPVRLPAPKKGQEHIAAGEEAFAEGRMQDAVDAFTKALADQPENDEALAYRAAAYVALSRLDKADEDLAAAMKLNTDFSLAWNTRGYIKWLRGEHAGAIEDYSSALAYAADDRRVDRGGIAQLHQNRGVAYQDLGNTDRALLDFNRCVELLPDNPAFLENRGLIYVDKELFDMAFRDFDAAVELDRKNARAYVNRAYAARLLGDYEQAVRDYSQAIRLRADYGQALIGRAYAWLGWERPELAKKDFESALKLEGWGGAAECGLGDVAAARGDFKEAELHYDLAVKLDSSNNSARIGLAVAQHRQGKLGHASATADKLCLLSPRDARHWALLARLLVEEKKWEKALIAANRALEMHADDVETRRNRLRCYARLGLHEAALNDADAIGERDFVAGQIDRARAYAIRNGEHDALSVLGTLENAKSIGIDLTSLADDPDFAPLKTNEKFRKLVGLD